MFDWNSLSGTSQAYLLIAIPSTLLLALQLVLMFIGMEMSHDIPHSGVSTDHHDTNAGQHFKVLTYRNVVAFFAMFGWTGLAMISNGYSKPVAFTVALLVGAAMALAISGIMYMFLKLAQDVTLDYSRAINQTATVYMPIPPKRANYGKINVVLNNQIIEVKAITDNETEISTSTIVVIRAVVDNMYLVEELVPKA